MTRSDVSAFSNGPRAAADSWTRRRFLGAAAASLGGAGLLLAGCGGSSPSSTSAAAAGPPKRGGTLNFGCITQGPETLDGQAAFGIVDWGRSYALYSGLARINQQGQVELWLAESIEPNKDATEWTIRIPAGITTHRGKPFGSKDILYSLARIMRLKTFGSNALAPDLIDLPNSKTLDSRTALVKFKAPFSQFKNALAIVWNVMVPEGFNPKDPDGTGPFMYKSFTSGQNTVMTRSPDYWESGKPYLDELIITEFQDESSQVNALQSGQVDLINYLSAASIETLKSGDAKTYDRNLTGGALLFTMRTDIPPFNDVRVRQAFRLLVDRPGMLREVYGGYGVIGNDIFNRVDPLYDTAIPQRVQDVAQAKALLKAAGHSNTSFQLYTCPSAAPGAVQAAAALATQASAAGARVQVVQQTSAAYFAKSYLKVPFGMDFWMTIPYLVESGMALAGNRAAFNTTHQNFPQWNKLWGEALATTDADKQKALAHELQMIEHTQGGNIIPMFFPDLDASSQQVNGIVPSAAATGPNAYFWPDVWKA